MIPGGSWERSEARREGFQRVTGVGLGVGPPPRIDAARVQVAKVGPPMIAICAPGTTVVERERE